MTITSYTQRYIEFHSATPVSALIARDQVREAYGDDAIIFVEQWPATDAPSEVFRFVVAVPIAHREPLVEPPEPVGVKRSPGRPKKVVK